MTSGWERRKYDSQEMSLGLSFPMSKGLGLGYTNPNVSCLSNSLWTSLCQTSTNCFHERTSSLFQQQQKVLVVRKGMLPEHCLFTSPSRTPSSDGLTKRQAGYISHGKLSPRKGYTCLFLWNCTMKSSSSPCSRTVQDVSWLALGTFFQLLHPDLHRQVEQGKDLTVPRIWHPLMGRAEAPTSWVGR